MRERSKTVLRSGMDSALFVLSPEFSRLFTKACRSSVTARFALITDEELSDQGNGESRER